MPQSRSPHTHALPACLWVPFVLHSLAAWSCAFIVIYTDYLVEATKASRVLGLMMMVVIQATGSYDICYYDSS